MNDLIKETINSHNAIFNRSKLCYWAQAPGRVNLIGEHTDYHKGYVLPFAISLYSIAILSPNNTDHINIYSEDYKETHTFSLKDKFIKKNNWTDRLEGLIRDLSKDIKTRAGFNIYVGGDLPIGKGLSSSAASMAAVGSVFLKFYNINFENLTFAYNLQRAEHIYGGVKCGIMDQLAVIMSQRDKALFIDCNNLNIEYVSIPDKWKIVLIDSAVRHNLATSEYNKRQDECDIVLNLLNKNNNKYTSLRDINLTDLAKILTQLSEKSYKRVFHVLSENERVLQSIIALKSQSEEDISKNLLGSHLSLKYNYEVSAEELDFLVEQAFLTEGIVAARMTGAGFGGCTINIVNEDQIDTFIGKMQSAYESKYNKKLWIKEVLPVDGLISGVYEDIQQ